MTFRDKRPLPAEELAEQQSMKYRKEIIRYRKALLAIVNGECVNPQEFALEVLNHDI